MYGRQQFGEKNLTATATATATGGGSGTGSGSGTGGGMDDDVYGGFQVRAFFL
jgi:hypothetical protein